MDTIFAVTSSASQSAGDGNEDIGAVRAVDKLRIDEVGDLLRTSDSAHQLDCSEATASLSASAFGGTPTLDTVIKRWHAERHGTFNKALALQTLRRLQRLRRRPTSNNGNEMEEILQHWQSIPPDLADAVEGAAALWPGWDELSQSMSGILMSQIVPSWLQPATSDMAGIVFDVASTLRQTGWVPRLDRRISQAPCFREIRNKYADISSALQRALTDFIDVRAEVLGVVRKGKSEKSAIDLYLASQETLAYYIDTAGTARVAHQQAAGIVRQRVADNRASLTVKVVEAGAATAMPNVLVSPLFEAVKIMARMSDRARANRVVDELNMRFADILVEGREVKAASDLEEEDIDLVKLQQQWRGPMESRLQLVAEALDYEAQQATDEQTHRLLIRQRDLVIKGELDQLDHESRAATLLVNGGELFRAAVKARMLGDGAVDRLSKAYCTRALSDTLSIVSEEASSALLDGICRDQAIDIAAAAAMAAESSFAMGASAMTTHVDSSATPSERSHVSTMSYLGQLTKGLCTNVAANVAATVNTLPQMWHNARDGIYGAQQGSAIDRDLAHARAMMAEGIIGACVGEVMTAAKTDGAVKAQRSLDAMIPLLYRLKRQGDGWGQNRLRDKLKTAYFSNADTAGIKELEQNKNTVLLLLKTGKTNLVFFKGLNPDDGKEAWYQLDDDGLNLRHVLAKPPSVFTTGLDRTVVEVLVASKSPAPPATVP